MPVEFQTVISLVEQICEGFERLAFVPDTGEEERLCGKRDRLLHLLRAKLHVELRMGLRAPMVIVVAGGTNVGKSTLFNQILEREVSRPEETAGATRSPAIHVAPVHEALASCGGYLAGFEVAPLVRTEDLNRGGEERRAYTTLSEADWLADFLVVDSPDVDSTVVENAGVSEDLLAVADGLVFVTTDQKYLDRRPLAYLEEAFRLRKEIFIVLNKMQDESMFETIRTDLERTLVSRVSEARAGSIRTFSLPFVSGGQVEIDPARELQRTVFRTEGLVARKREALAGGSAQVFGAGRELLECHRQERQEVDRLRDGLDRLNRSARLEHERFARRLATEEFHELDAAIEQILREARVPILDDVVDRVRDVVGGAARWVGRKILSREPGPAGAEEKLRRRRDGHRDLLVSIFSRVATDWVQELRNERDRHPVVRAAYEHLQGAVPIDADRLRRVHEEGFTEVESFAAHVESDLRSWLADHPSRKVWLVACRLAVRAGVGVTAILLTGGIGFEDLLVGPLSAAVVGELTPPGFTRPFQDRLVALHQQLYDQMFEVCLLAPFTDAFGPLGVPDAGTEAIERDLGLLREALLQAGIEIP